MSPPAPPVEPVLRELCTYLAGKSRSRLSPEQLDTAGNLWLAGYVDSLSYVEFLVHIENRYGVAISDAELTSELSSLRAIADCICLRAGKTP